MNYLKRWTAIALAVVMAVYILLPTGAMKAEATEKSNQVIIYEYLVKELKLPSSAACGILANIERESGFDPKAGGDGGASYGLVQWYDVEFYGLVSYCRNNNLDYTSLSAQLTYMSYELHGEYSSLYHYLQRLPDDADGAYKAGYKFCYDYERPSGILTASESRGELARDKYWPKYGKKAVTSETAKAPVLSDASIPGSMTQGGNLTLEGTITSNVELTQVKVAFYYANENEALSASVNPGAISYSLKNISQEIKADQLEPGCYMLEITAENAGGPVVLASQMITVLSRLATRKNANVQFQLVDDRSLGLAAAENGSEMILTDKLSFTRTRFQVVAATGGYYSIRSLSEDKYLTTDKNTLGCNICIYNCI